MSLLGTLTLCKTFVCFRPREASLVRRTATFLRRFSRRFRSGGLETSFPVKGSERPLRTLWQKFLSYADLLDLMISEYSFLGGVLGSSGMSPE